MERCDLWVLLWLAVVSRASVEIEKSELSVEKLSCDGDRSIRHETARTGVDGDGFDIVMIPHTRIFALFAYCLKTILKNTNRCI